MLLELDIRDLAVTEHVRAAFAPGLNVITGETGAGKSVIIDALGLLLGGRADAGMVRAGAAAARLQGVFQLDPEALSRTMPELAQTLAEAGAEPEDGLLVVARDVPAGGRGVARLNGRVAVLSSLAQIGERLVDIHGQHDHTALLQPSQHLRILDRFGDTGAQRRAVAETVRRLRAVRAELERLHGNERERVRLQERLSFEVDEISRAQLRPDEEDELRAERTLLENAVQLAELAEAGYAALRGGGRIAGAEDALGRAAELLAQLAALDPRLQDDAATAAALQEQAADLARNLREYRDAIEHNPARLAAIEERLSLLSQLKRKYGATVAEVIAYGERAAQELAELSGSEETAARLTDEERALLAALSQEAEALSRARMAAAATLVAEVEAQLRDLRLPNARLGIAFSRRLDDRGVETALPAEQIVDAAAPARTEGAGRYAFETSGIDRVEFMISLNPDEPLRPLARVASGGETSRVLLALKAVLGQADNVPILVFDEIEAGLGGRTGGVVGEKLVQLAQHHQVICITHLPQIAARAANHLSVSKRVEAGRTLVEVRRLEAHERIEEIAAMLGGVTPANLTSARELLGVGTQDSHAVRAI